MRYRRIPERRGEWGRLAACVLAAISLLWVGLGEMWRCIRGVLPTETMTYQEAADGGLSSDGYIRITGVRPALNHIEVMEFINVHGGERWFEGTYAPLLPAGVTEPPSEGVPIVLWLRDAKSTEDAMESLSGRDRILVRAKCSFDEIHSSHQHRLRGFYSGKPTYPDDCIVAEVVEPSLVRGVGAPVTGAGLLGAALVAWKRRDRN